jgi:hypothetical protein
LLLTQNPAIQEELHLSAAQRSAVGQLFQELRGRFQEDFNRLRQVGPQSAAAAAELKKRVAAAGQTALAGVLKPEQLQRLHEIELQGRGAEVLADPSVQAALDLTPDQKARVGAFLQLQAAAARDLVRKSREQGSPQPVERLLAERRREALEPARALLTDEQRASLARLLGAPFTFRPGTGTRPAGHGESPGESFGGGPDLEDL